ncbi:hypothetical protein EV643_1353 [Kribbella sp. VKM Ac-2527]|uniref:Uncharacterized protein n=1 Tax=Kribbella caucasensis TaxID=2512215 RepID=A0A4R6J754_9ACTN|nr:hypothetical protein EV643_1353 [Kribbella sp. VKM Ac-2527]
MNCAVCGREMSWQVQGGLTSGSAGVVELARNDPTLEWLCWYGPCVRRRLKAERRARKDARRIAEQEANFAEYTEALIKLASERARREAR